MIVSVLFVFFGVIYIIKFVIKIFEILEIGKELIVLSVVVFGILLLELMVIILVVRKGNLEIVVGNVLGFNIFNLLIVMGILRLIGKLEIFDDVFGSGLLVLLVGIILFFFVI